MDITSNENGVESIMYGIVCSILYLAYVVIIVSHFMANPIRVNWGALKGS